jgi:hypothetical protein
MLDTLLVLGQVPGTDFYITFSEVLLFGLVAILRWEEKRYRRQIRRQVSLLRYRFGVAWRRLKRLTRSYIKFQHYRLVLIIRQSKRDIKRHVRTQKRQLFREIYKSKRQIIWQTKKAYRAPIRFVEARIRRTKRKARLALRRQMKRQQHGHLGWLFRVKKTKLESPVNQQV